MEEDGALSRRLARREGCPVVLLPANHPGDVFEPWDLGNEACSGLRMGTKHAVFLGSELLTGVSRIEDMLGQREATEQAQIRRQLVLPEIVKLLPRREPGHDVAN